MDLRSGAVRHLTAFWAAMRQWELEAHALSKRVRAGDVSEDEYRSRCTAMLAEIFSKYVAGTMSDDRLRQHSYEVPPSYDPAGEVVVSVTEDGPCAKVLTEQKHSPLKLRLVYHVCGDENNGFWIENNRQRIDRAGREVPWDL